jgi:hypothetical protein
LFGSVVDIGDKFFAGVIDTAEQFGTGDKYSFANIFEKIQNGPNGILGGLGNTDS